MKVYNLTKKEINVLSQKILANTDKEFFKIDISDNVYFSVLNKYSKLEIELIINNAMFYSNKTLCLNNSMEIKNAIKCLTDEVNEEFLFNSCNKIADRYGLDELRSKRKVVDIVIDLDEIDDFRELGQESLFILTTMLLIDGFPKVDALDISYDIDNKVNLITSGREELSSQLENILHICHNIMNSYVSGVNYDYEKDLEDI